MGGRPLEKLSQEVVPRSFAKCKSVLLATLVHGLSELLFRPVESRPFDPANVRDVHEISLRPSADRSTSVVDRQEAWPDEENFLNRGLIGRNRLTKPLSALLAPRLSLLLPLASTFPLIYQNQLSRSLSVSLVLREHADIAVEGPATRAEYLLQRVLIDDRNALRWFCRSRESWISVSGRRGDYFRVEISLFNSPNPMCLDEGY